MGFEPALEVCDFEVAEVVVAGDALEVTEEGFGATLEVALCGAHGLDPLFLFAPGKQPPGDFCCDRGSLYVSHCGIQGVGEL